ncbi:aldo/keto reductase [Undibacterium sp. Di27W]|uniref:aldo/keto reductase n=1 Tax=Undibacterium sp. Di27W TaxID=3413036 RepID=UPI003BF1D772
MNEVQLGKGGPFVSRLGLGTMMMGWRLNPSESESIIASAHEQGISFIDTSVSYARGECHQIIGGALRNLQLQNQFFIATKVGGISNDDDPPSHRGYAKNNIVRQCELALTQLGVDSIDLLQLHTPTKEFTYHEMLEALVLLQQQGKIKYFGVCNYAVEDMETILSYANGNQALIPLTNQFEYNLLNCLQQNSIFQLLETAGIGTITWGPLASGLLSEWYTKNDASKPGGRIDSGREKEQKLAVLNKPSTQIILKSLARLSAETNIPAQALALIYLLQTRPANCTLLGPSSLQQFNELMACLEARAAKPVDFSSLELLDA